MGYGHNIMVLFSYSWPKDPTLTELENLLANQEDLDKQMSEV